MNDRWGPWLRTSRRSRIRIDQLKLIVNPVHSRHLRRRDRSTLLLLAVFDSPCQKADAFVDFDFDVKASQFFRSQFLCNLFGQPLVVDGRCRSGLRLGLAENRERSSQCNSGSHCGDAK